ncbi:MAG: DUF2948 family protein [Pseudomonadota bacterium]
MSSPKPLKIAALDEKDLNIVSAHVQDAVLKVGEVIWSPKQRQLIMPMNRFAWENTLDRKARRKGYERRRSVLHVDKVSGVQSSGIVLTDKTAVLSILTVVFDPLELPGGHINIVCAGDAMLRLEVECIEVRLTDLGGAWEASMRPKHPVRGTL